MSEKLYLYELMDNGTPEAYDEAMAVACMQGLINRAGAYLYVTCPDDDAHRNGQIGDTQWGPQLKRPRCTPRYWLDIFTAPGEWLSGREQVWLHGLQEVYELTKPYIKGAVIWDTEVPGTVNVATTIAGVEDLIVMSPELYLSFGIKMGIPVAKDLRGKFDGSETGSRRCDAYRWAVREYIDTGKCTSTVIGQYLDAWRTRDIGLTSYVLERDRMVAERAFVFDLNPWGTFAPLNDPDQPIGTDKATYLYILERVYHQAGGKHMTEFCGFFNAYALEKGEPNGVITEWESVYLMSRYNCYQNTAANDVYNQSFHKWAGIPDLKQQRPKAKRPLENKVYLCIQICDMDSTTPLYDVMPVLWDDPRRGEYPLAWGIDPNLYGVLPDVYTHYRKTASEKDYFVADSSGAGYFNASRILPQHWDMVVEHNKYWYEKTDTTISGMVLDNDNPSMMVLKNYAKFSPDGFNSLTCICRHPSEQPVIRPQVVDGMPVGYMTHAACDWTGPKGTCESLNQVYFSKFTPGRAQFLYYRICYRSPSELFDLYEELKRTNPQLDIELVDPYTYFDLLRQRCLNDARECAPDRN